MRVVEHGDQNLPSARRHGILFSSMWFRWSLVCVRVCMCGCVLFIVVRYCYCVHIGSFITTVPHSLYSSCVCHCIRLYLLPKHSVYAFTYATNFLVLLLMAIVHFISYFINRLELESCSLISLIIPLSFYTSPLSLLLFFVVDNGWSISLSGTQVRGAANFKERNWRIINHVIDHCCVVVIFTIVGLF